MSDDLISIKTRNEFREHMVGWVLREISDEFSAARIDCDRSYRPPVSGERRAFIEQYYHTIDWSDWEVVKRVFGVFEEVLRNCEREKNRPDNLEGFHAGYDTLILCLKKDGFQWLDQSIVPLPRKGLSLLADIKSRATKFDAAHMEEQIRRIENSIDPDPSLAIGTAKELIETCCKTILEERGITIPETFDVPTLTKATFKELKLVPDEIDGAARGYDVIKRLLSNLGTIGAGVAELRNLYGTGHGKKGKATGLKPRHAKLAVGASATLVRFLFETHEESKKKPEL